MAWFLRAQGTFHCSHIERIIALVQAETARNFRMARKPTYEELKQRVKELEKEAIERKGVEEVLQESEEKYRRLFEDSLQGV